MKKITALFILFAGFQAEAQTYQKMLADSITQFHVVPLGIPIRAQQNTSCTYANPGDFTAEKDSVFSGLTYKKFFEYGTNFLGLMREDTLAKKVYFIQNCNTTEDLLYDFSLQQGDSINYTFPNSTSYILSGWYKVDSIKFMHDYLNFSRKHFYMHNRLNPTVMWNGPPASLEMIEGVGCTNHPIFLFAGFYIGELGISGTSNLRCFDTQYDELLSCKWDNGLKIYFDSCAYATAQSSPCVSHNDSCNYGTNCSNIKEFIGIKTVSAYPVPASDLLNLEIETEKQMDLSFSFVTAFGVEVKKDISRQLMKGKNSLQIAIKDLPEGIYLLRISDSNKTIGKTILIYR